MGMGDSDIAQAYAYVCMRKSLPGIQRGGR